MGRTGSLRLPSVGISTWPESRRFPDFLAGTEHLFLDRAPWHQHHIAEAELRKHAVHVHLLPATAGKWLNPLYQAFHRTLRQHFRRLQRERPEEALRNLIELATVELDLWAREQGLIKTHLNLFGL